MLFSLAHKHKHKHKKNKHVRSSCAYAYAYALCLCLFASENSIRQISGFVLLMFLLMLTLMSRVFSLVVLMLCLCASENQPLRTIDAPTCPSQERPMVDSGTFFKFAIQISHSKYFTNKDDITLSAFLSFPIKFSSNFTAIFE